MYREKERAAAPKLTVHPNTAAHQLHQLRGNREPQSITAIFSRHTAIALHERLKNPPQLVWRYADSRVPYAKPKLKVRVCNRLNSGMNPDLTLQRELDGIAEKIY